MANGRSASPYVWRVRYALAHKGLAFDSVPLGFTEIQTFFAGRFKTLPVIADGATMLAESWGIVEYLDQRYPEKPLFAGAADQAAIRLLDAWLSFEVLRRMLRIYVLDVHNAARPEDRSYFRQSREARFQMTLEAYTADRGERLSGLREALMPLRMQLRQSAFLGGTVPSYADYIALGAFQWIGSVSSLPALAKDDTVLREWLERGFDLYDGLGRDPRLQPLFE